MALKRPALKARKGQGKPKRIDPAPDSAMIAMAAENANYSPSDGDYHCKGSKGQPPQSRTKYASICPRRWSVKEATAALRAGIENCRVSEAWEDGFPRYVWHVDGQVVYEARHTRGPHGTYHAYPLEESQFPDGLR